MTVLPSTDSSVVDVRKHLREVVRRLKVRGVWQYLEPPVRGWLSLACKLEGIKFRSRTVLQVLFKILNRVKPLLDFPGLVAGIGVRHAWRASQVAASWGNSNAKSWRNDKNFQIYCGLMAIQLARVIPGAGMMELDLIKNVLNFRGFRKFFNLFKRMM